uniref:Uncharacterized protein n=1 Tax=Rhizophora mucronata TaxID=61149 RepID=A0A2P2IKZ7_RHIMU
MVLGPPLPPGRHCCSYVLGWHPTNRKHMVLAPSLPPGRHYCSYVLGWYFLWEK